MVHWNVDLEDFLCPGINLYPDTNLYPGSLRIGISDSNVNIFSLNKDESIIITDTNIKTIIKYLEEGGSYPHNELYPTGIVYPNSGLPIVDVCGKNTNKFISDYLSIIDVFSRLIALNLSDDININDSVMKRFIKYLYESGLTPDNILYPHNTMYPDGGINVYDNYMLDFGKTLTSTLSVIDDIGKSIIKDIPDDINISDNILFGIYLHLNENPNIFDGISKHQNKMFDELFTIVDIITKNVLKGVPENIIITDVMVYDMRKLVRATLEAFKNNYASLEALKNKYAVLNTE